MRKSIQQRIEHDRLIRRRWEEPAREVTNKNVSKILQETLDSGEYVWLANKSGELMRNRLPAGVTVKEVLAGIMIHHAMRGNIAFVRELLNRTEGKVPTRLADANGENLSPRITMVEILAPQVGQVREAQRELIANFSETKNPAVLPVFPVPDAIDGDGGIEDDDGETE